QRLLGPLVAWGRADVMMLPHASLQDHIVRIVLRESVDDPLVHIVDRRAIRRVGFPEFAMPPFLGEEPRSPHGAERSNAMHRLGRVITRLKACIRLQRGDLTLESHIAMRPALRGTGGRD